MPIFQSTEKIIDSVNSRSMLSTAVTTVVVSLLSILTILITAKAIGPLPISLTQTIAEKNSTFDVVGESEVTIVPDEAQVSVGVRSESQTAGQTQDQLNETINSVVENIIKLGIDREDVRTTNYSISPRYNYSDGRQSQIGFEANATVRVSVKEFAQVNQVIDTAVSSGATDVSGVAFVMSDELEATTREQARKDAIEDAKENATKLSSLAGMKLGKVVNVTEGNSSMNQPYFARELSMDKVALDAPTQIEPGSTNYTYTVTLSYETL